MLFSPGALAFERAQAAPLDFYGAEQPALHEKSLVRRVAVHGVFSDGMALKLGRIDGGAVLYYRPGREKGFEPAVDAFLAGFPLQFVRHAEAPNGRVVKNLVGTPNLFSS